MTNTLIRDENIKLTIATVREELLMISEKEAGLISAKIEAISELTSLYAEQTVEALNSTSIIPESELSRWKSTRNGVWYTAVDDGNAAGFYSMITQVGEAELEKAARLAETDGLIKQMVNSNELVTQAYLNTYDSLNRIYPFF